MNIAGFYPDSISNGEGWRAVLFVSGCPHHCPNCQNQVTWDASYGVPYVENKIYEQIMENEFLDGVTLSGGEPLLYCKELLPLVKRLKANGLTVWSYTGFLFELLFERSKKDSSLRSFLEELDVLVDGRFESDKKDLSIKFRGSSNQRIIDVPKSIQAGQVVLHPLN